MDHSSPTPETFAKLLLWLDSDRDKAGEKYERIRHRMIRIFAAKGCWEAEDMADQTINVVASKIDGLLESYEGEPALYFYGVGKNIFLEWRKKNPPPSVPFPSPDSSETERLHGCLDRSLQEIPAEDRKLVLEYHEGEKRARIDNRKRLAQELGISSNALRVKVCHIHFRLRQVMERYLEQFPGE